VASRSGGLVGGVIVVLSLASAGDAVACSMIALREHVIDPAELGVDVTAPEPPSATAGVSRSPGPDSAGCGKTMSTSCDGSGTIHFAITPGADDRTSAEELGYSVRLVSGTPPAGLTLPDKPLLAHGANELWVFFPDPGPDDQEPFDAVFELIAVDAAGNESAPSAPVRAEDGGDTGCAVVGSVRRHRDWPALFFALGVGTLLRRRLRRR